MNKSLFGVVLVAVAICGCTRTYVMKLSNGRQVTTASKPQLKGGNYYFKDAKGQVAIEPQSRVREIVPASIAAEEKKQYAPKQPAKKRHWYLLWLG